MTGERELGLDPSSASKEFSENSKFVKYLSSEDIKAFHNKENKWIISPTNLSERTIGSIKGDTEWNNLVLWVEEQLFMPDKDHFAVIKIPLSLLVTSIDDDIEELFSRGDDVKCSLLQSLLQRGVSMRYPSYFLSGNKYDVAGRHMKKDKVHQCTELGLHWDPLEISVLGTTYHKDKAFIGGRARVADLAAYLKRYGCFTQVDSNQVSPFCTLPYPPQESMDPFALSVLESPRFQKCIYLPYDCITILLCNNHIDLFNPERCGVLHDAFQSCEDQAPAKRRVALCSIQDVSHAEQFQLAREAYRDQANWNIYIKYPYITPQFRSMAASCLLNKQNLLVEGFWDGEKHEWFQGQPPAGINSK